MPVFEWEEKYHQLLKCRMVGTLCVCERERERGRRRDRQRDSDRKKEEHNYLKNFLETPDLKNTLNGQVISIHI